MQSETIKTSVQKLQNMTSPYGLMLTKAKIKQRHSKKKQASLSEAAGQ